MANPNTIEDLRGTDYPELSPGVRGYVHTPVSRQLPPSLGGNPRLNHTAESIGSAVGSAVERVRELPRRLQGRMQEMKQRFTVIRGRARGDASEAARDLKQTAEQKIVQARSRAAHYAREYPIQVILAVTGAAFILGFSLRIWRSTRD
jgi:ElaB/YqjD/DUF883 family membrane-anchored ribosome-binding protein